MSADSTEFFESFAALSRAVTALAAQSYATADMGSTQAKFLRQIGKRGTMVQADLARETGTDPTLTSRVLKALLDRELVRRERSADDRRDYLLTLTPAGKRARARAEKLRAEMAARVVRTLDAHDMAEFARIARKVLAGL